MVELASNDDGTGLSPAVYERVFYSIQNPALVIDLEFTIRDANQAAADFLDYDSREQLLGTSVERILANPSILNEVAAQITENQYWTGEAEIMTADERVRTGVGTAVPILVEGEPQMIAGVFTDMTERRRYTRSLKVLNRILRHNIRNDANMLLGTLEQIAMATGDEGIADYVEKAQSKLHDIVGNADTARELELLLLDQGDPSVDTIRLDRVLEDVLEEIDHDQVTATFEYPDELPATKVLGVGSISRIVREVIENAVAHNDAAEPVVRASIEQAETTVCLRVADNGPGIPQERRDLIFGREELSQLHHGDGFSLFFVDQVMDVVGGDVWVEDSELGGAAFVLEFPRPH